MSASVTRAAISESGTEGAFAIDDQAFLIGGITAAMARVGLGPPEGLERLTGGATMESWRFSASGESFVLRRAPSLAFIEGRPFGHDVEAAIIRAARVAGVLAPEVLVELQPGDGIGSGFIMRALPGSAAPGVILDTADGQTLLRDAANNLAAIHSLARASLPPGIPEQSYGDGVSELRRQFEDFGGDRPIIALGLRWLFENLPAPVDAVLNHGDYRLGNILVDGSRLSGVLDWELAHWGDPHEDLAFGCMAVWRFARYDRPALGLGSTRDYFAAYEEAGGCRVDPARIRFWLIYRTVWWALGCLRNAAVWRSGGDRMLERVVISRRTSEQELDLLLLLEEDAPSAVRNDLPAPSNGTARGSGEASDADLAVAVSEWLATLKHQVDGHQRFQLAVARNALGMIARSEAAAEPHDRALSQSILSGSTTLASPGLLARLRRSALDKLAADVPKYPALAAARNLWIGKG